MTTQDHNQKTLRQSQCRDYLWEIFEQMGAELECSTDYLVNEAMRQYARSRNWGNRGASRAGVPLPTGGSVSGQLPAQPAAPLPAPVQAPQPARAMQPAAMPPAMAPTPVVASVPAVTQPPPIGRKPAPSGQVVARPSTTTGSFPPPLPGGPVASAQRSNGGMPSLFVIFNGQKV